MLPILFSAYALITSVAAAPHGKHVQAASSQTYNLQHAIDHMNLDAAPSPSPLAAPEPGMELFQVVVGRGTQNYTCDVSNATAAPQAVGALATLYNVTELATKRPALLRTLTRLAMFMDPDAPCVQGSEYIQGLISGYHYFLDGTTPYFNLDTDAHSYGAGAVEKTSVADAPADATPGQPGQAYGAAAWLMLSKNSGDAYVDGDWSRVYRLNTAGGNPPDTCEGREAAFTIEYAAQYWIFR